MAVWFFLKNVIEKLRIMNEELRMNMKEEWLMGFAFFVDESAVVRGFSFNLPFHLVE